MADSQFPAPYKGTPPWALGIGFVLASFFMVYPLLKGEVKEYIEYRKTVEGQRITSNSDMLNQLSLKLTTLAQDVGDLSATKRSLESRVDDLDKQVSKVTDSLKDCQSKLVDCATGKLRR